MKSGKILIVVGLVLSLIGPVWAKDYTCFNIKSKSNITSEELDSFFGNTGLKGLGKSFKKAEDEYGINAQALAGIAIEESGWGNRCSRPNNLVGFEARGKEKKKNRYASFRSKEECINTVAKHLANNYVNPGGKYFYKSAELKNINHYYCEVATWKYNIAKIIKRMDEYVGRNRQEFLAVDSRPDRFNRQRYAGRVYKSNAADMDKIYKLVGKHFLALSDYLSQLVWNNRIPSESSISSESIRHREERMARFCISWDTADFRNQVRIRGLKYER